MDRQQQLLRASLAVGSRVITLYEELHPYRKLANRKVQHRFVDQLKRMVPAQDLGDALWVRNHPLAGRLVLIMQQLRGRKHRSLAGSARRGNQSRKHAYVPASRGC